MKPRLLVLTIILALGLLIAFPAFADNLYGSIRGTVVDPTGAVVSGATLTATNAATGITFTTKTNQDGIFNFLQLPYGNYNVKVEQPGFKSYQASGIHIDVNQIYNLPVKLEVGTVSEALVVEANPVQVQQTDMQLGSTIEGQQIVGLPLNGRNWTQLMQLQPGVIGTTDRFGGGGAVSGNGAQTQQNDFLINGVDSNDAALNTPLVIPSPDAIGEFRQIDNTLNPEYGRNSGSVINAQIKSGSNAFHGSGFEFYRDTFLDAKSYFDYPCRDANGNLKSDCRSPFHQNEYGGTIGGPIIKDKTFFFFSYQGFRQRIPQAAASKVITLSTDQYQNGIFGAGFAGGNGSPIPLWGDGCPYGGPQCPAGTPFSTLFASGNVPIQDFNPLAVKLVNQFVPVNAAGSVQVSPTTVAHDHQLLGRLDHKITNNDQVWFYGLWETHPSQDTLPFTGTNLPGLGEQALRHQQQYSFSYTHTFTPTLLNEFRLGYTRFNFAAVDPIAPINPTSYGFTGIIPQNPGIASLPVITTPNFTLGFSSNGPQPRVQNVYQLTDNLSKVWGHHTFKVGFTADRPSVDNPFYNRLSGAFAFQGGGPNSTGNGTVDFLLGIPDSYNQGSGSVVHAKAHEIYSYFQDQWQIRPNLTITYGTGWEVFTPWKNSYANGLIMGAWRPGQQSTVFPTAPPGFVYPGDAGINQYGGPSPKYDLLAPRFGFAWSPDAERKWSVHGGIGMYYNRTEEEMALQTLTNPPFAITSVGTTGATPTAGVTVTCSPGFATPFLNVDGNTCLNAAGSAVAQQFPFIPPAAGNKSIDFANFAPVGVGVSAMDPKLTAPRSVNFNLTIERQLDKATIISLAYVGNRGRHEESAINGNYAGVAPGINPVAAAAGCPFGYAMLGCAQTPITENPDHTWTNGTPVPGATPYNLGIYGQPGIELTEYNSKYDSMQLVLNRHFSRGLQVLAAYTWSRYFDQTSSLESSAFNFPGINPFCGACNWGPSANDAPQRFVVSYTYTLPFYSLTHKWKRLTDGWNLSGIYTLQHGTPVGLFDFLNFGITCDINVSFYACPGQAVRTGAPLGIRDPRNNNGNNPQNLYFNPAAFYVPASGALGTANRNPVYGPGINYGDMAIEKEIHIDETRFLELRLETYNTFNHTNFGQPADYGFNTADVPNPICGSGGCFGQTGKVYTTKTISTNGEGRAVQLGVKFYF